MMMKFEFLPNEILLETFKFLHLFDIFYSLNYLNNRLNKLIRSIPLDLNLKNVSKSTFDQFCQLLEVNPEIKDQVFSIELSNENRCTQIERFLSRFLLNQFSHLHSLILIPHENDHIVRILSIPILPFNTSNFSLITKLTISTCSMKQILNQLIQYAPMLKYLNIHQIKYTLERNDSYVIRFKAIHLQELILTDFEYQFTDYRTLMEHTPNLLSLELCAYSDRDTIDANQWEYLITDSLPHLEIFKFIFSYRSQNTDKFHQFQTDFWLVKHHWHTEYSFTNDFIMIYTIPYMLDYFELQENTTRYGNNIFNIFDKVTNLTVYDNTIKESCQYYFPNVTSLTILYSNHLQQSIISKQTIHLLKKLTNLSNLKHIGISSKIRFESRLLLLTILEEAPQLSSIKTDARLVSDGPFFTSTFHDYLKERIKTLDIYDYNYPSINNRCDLDRFCTNFSNLEQLICTVIE
ncbi:unnamed protein product [Adineta steineri]|uniref:F-box domain-containing protein n=1 Tax=Adineta steineri TaxID=433720 RepID=A0A818ZQF7_9BILA|nr:unnamed protein product [Adineta steineri]CAF3766645.1 unnamed protein product [Adineta steineri]